MGDLQKIGLALAMMSPYTRPAAQAIQNWQEERRSRDFQQEYLDMARARDERARTEQARTEAAREALGKVTGFLAQNPDAGPRQLFQVLDTVPDQFRPGAYELAINHIQNMNTLNKPTVDALMKYGGNVRAGDPTHRAIGQMGLEPLLTSEAVEGHDPGFDLGPMVGPGGPKLETRTENWTFKGPETRLREQAERETQNSINKKRAAIAAGVDRDPNLPAATLDYLGYEEFIDQGLGKGPLDYIRYKAEAKKQQGADETTEHGKKVLAEQRAYNLNKGRAQVMLNRVIRSDYTPTREELANMSDHLSDEDLDQALKVLGKRVGVKAGFFDNMLFDESPSLGQVAEKLEPSKEPEGQASRKVESKKLDQKAEITRKLKGQRQGRYKVFGVEVLWDGEKVLDD